MVSVVQRGRSAHFAILRLTAPSVSVLGLVSAAEAQLNAKL